MNNLQNSSSLYLRQHAANPVNWYPWGDEPFRLAQEQNKLLIISIGYSSCHWCHVMEHESFEDPEIADYMNENFICIKVDREEHPEVDSYYMFALQAMTGHGGWPLNIFATPEGQPIYGGTYFPPRPMQGRPSWLQMLMRMHKSWEEKDPEIKDSVEQFQKFVHDIESQIESDTNPDGTIDEAQMLSQLVAKIDPEYGGFSQAPKFPMLMTLDWMLELAIKLKDENAISLVKNNLRKMLHGGIYDQVQGGLMRYSVDGIWLVPHFEKMLYTQSQLIPLLARCKMLYPEEELWDSYLDHTMKYMSEWLGDPADGYASSVDADSEGGEGYYYTFSSEEVNEILEDDAAKQLFQIQENGNFEGRNILHFSDEVTAENVDAYIDEFCEIQKSHPRPTIDTKRITSWNAFLAIGYARSYLYTADVMYHEMFMKLSDYLVTRCRFSDDEVSVQRIVYDTGETVAGVGEDYALMGLVYLYRFRFDQKEDDLQSAQKIIKYIETNYKKGASYTNARSSESQLPQHAFEFMDDMIPDINSVMMENYQVLGILTQTAGYRDSLVELSDHLSAQVTAQPIYRAYAGRRFSMDRQLVKVETSLAWSDIRTPTAESKWLLKKPLTKEEGVYLQVCNSSSCMARITDKDSCIEYFYE